MFHRLITTHLLCASLMIGLTPNLSIAESSLTPVLYTMKDILSTVNSLNEKPNQCETPEVMSLEQVNRKGVDCQRRLDSASVKVINCMDVYRKSLDSEKASPVDCHGMAKPSPNEIAAQQKIMSDTIIEITQKFDSNENPDFIYSKLSPGEKKILETYLNALGEVADTETFGIDIAEVKKETETLQKITDLNTLKNLGFDLEVVDNGDSIKTDLNKQNFNPAKLKNINAPEYKAIENLMGKDIALNLKKMYSDSKDLKRGGTVAVIIGDQVIIPNYGTKDSTPKIITKKEFDDLERKHFSKFMTYSEECLRLSQNYSATSHTMKQMALGILPALIGRDFKDEVLEKKWQCENDMARELYYLYATLGLDKDKTAQVISQAREVLRIDSNNISKVQSRIEAVSKAQKGVLIASAVIATGGAIGIATGAAIVSTAVFSGVAWATGGVVYNATESIFESFAGPGGLACYHVNFAETMFEKTMGSMKHLPMTVSIGMLLPIVGPMIGAGAAKGLSGLSYIAKRPNLVANIYRIGKFAPKAGLVSMWIAGNAKGTIWNFKETKKAYDKASTTKEGGFEEAAELEKWVAHKRAIKTAKSAFETVALAKRSATEVNNLRWNLGESTRKAIIRDKLAKEAEQDLAKEKTK